MFISFRRRWRLCGVVLSACTAVMFFAQPVCAEGARFDNGKVAFTVSVDKPELAPGDVVKLTIKCVPAAGWHTYPVEKESSPEALGLIFKDTDSYSPLWKQLDNQPPAGPVLLSGGTMVTGYETPFTSSIYVW